MAKLLSVVAGILGSIGSLVGGIFSALQFFGTKTVKKSRKIVWRVFHCGSHGITIVQWTYSERA